MEDSKIFMFPDNGTKQTSNDVNSLLPYLLMGNGNGMNGGGWLWVIFLFFLYPLMRNGGLFGNGTVQGNNGCLGNLASMVNNNDGRDLLMQAINGNGSAIQNLANMFGTKADVIQTAISQASIGITQVGCKIDASTGSIINAGTQNTMTLASQLASCCCNLKTAITEGNYQNQIATIQQTDALKESVGGVGNAVTSGFANMSFALRDQTCNIEKVVDGVGDRIIDKLNASEKSAMQDKINALQTQLTTEHQSGVIAQQIAAAVNPIAATVAEIKAAQPATITTPYQPFVAVPNCIAAQMGYYGYGVNGSGNSFWY